MSMVMLETVTGDHFSHILTTGAEIEIRGKTDSPGVDTLGVQSGKLDYNLAQ